MVKSIEVMSRSDAAAFESELPWAAISIASEPGYWPELKTTNRVDCLRMAFYDVSNEQFVINTGLDTTLLFCRPHAAEVLDFAERIWEQADILVVHCEMGRSRSPAVAAALSKVYFGDDKRYFNRYTPNSLVYHEILKEHYARSRD